MNNKIYIKKTCPLCGDIGTVSTPLRIDSIGNFQAGTVMEQTVCPKCNGVGEVDKGDKVIEELREKFSEGERSSLTDDILNPVDFKSLDNS